MSGDGAVPHLAPRYVRGLQEQARLGHALGNVAEAMAAEVQEAMKDAGARVAAAEKRAAEAEAFRGRFAFELKQHFKASDTLSEDEVVRLLARTGEPPAANESTP